MPKSLLGIVAVLTLLAGLAAHSLAQAEGTAPTSPVTTIQSSITSADPVQVGRLERPSQNSTCAAPVVRSPVDGIARHYKTFQLVSLINEVACLTLTFNTSACPEPASIQSSVYSGAFNPANLAANEITTQGPGASPSSYQVSAAGGQTLTLAVNELIAGSGCSAFTVDVRSSRPWASHLPRLLLGGAEAAGRSVQVGETLTAEAATWAAPRVSSADRWQSCDASGQACSNIAGADLAQFTPDESLVGKTLRLVEGASDDSGVSSVTSALTGPVTPLPPPGPGPPPALPSGTQITSVKITQGKGKRKASASFGFKAWPRGTGFQCALQRPKGHALTKLTFKPCSSPKAYKDLKAGRYKFSVQAVNSVGVDPSTAIRVFVVN